MYYFFCEILKIFARGDGWGGGHTVVLFGPWWNTSTGSGSTLHHHGRHQEKDDGEEGGGGQGQAGGGLPQRHQQRETAPQASFIRNVIKVSQVSSKRNAIKKDPISRTF